MSVCVCVCVCMCVCACVCVHVCGCVGVDRYIVSRYFVASASFPPLFHFCVYM